MDHSIKDRLQKAVSKSKKAPVQPQLSIAYDFADSTSSTITQEPSIRAQAQLPSAHEPLTKPKSTRTRKTTSIQPDESSLSVSVATSEVAATASGSTVGATKLPLLSHPQTPQQLDAYPTVPTTMSKESLSSRLVELGRVLHSIEWLERIQCPRATCKQTALVQQNRATSISFSPIVWTMIDTLPDYQKMTSLPCTTLLFSRD